MRKKIYIEQKREDPCIHLIEGLSVVNQSPASKYPRHLPPALPNCLNRRTVTKIRTDGHIYKSATDNYAFINKIGAVWKIFYGRMIRFLLASLILIFLGVLLTFYSLLESARDCELHCPLLLLLATQIKYGGAAVEVSKWVPSRFHIRDNVKIIMLYVYYLTFICKTTLLP